MKEESIMFIKMKKLKNQSAFTLIEVLAAVILLSIVIILTLSIFPHMANLNDKSENNLNTVSVGKEILYKMRDVFFSEIDTGSVVTLNTSNDLPINLTEIKCNKVTYESTCPKNGPIILKGTYEYFEKNYNVEITIQTTIESGTKSFRKLKIDIKNSNNTVLTTTHGYLKY